MFRVTVPTLARDSADNWRCREVVSRDNFLIAQGGRKIAIVAEKIAIESENQRQKLEKSMKKAKGIRHVRKIGAYMTDFAVMKIAASGAHFAVVDDENDRQR